MKAESAEQLKAEPYERNGEPFKTFVFDNYCRSEAALITSMAEMVVNGVSTRKVAKVMETLCDKSFSKSTVSEACKELDQKVNEFRNRPLDCEYPFITVDATYFKVRENSRIVSKALMIAYAVSSSGVREIIGFDVYKNESKSTWDGEIF
ncbi:IS256 family transposase [Eubacterium xylanophilum]|uniref:IS256 family transposase n=1 Tax=Eubacterium xylanophilum TaxID=39497 RepID=UPI0004B23C39|nr:IS256 family transposase [Eubacterium xylanophilum]